MQRELTETETELAGLNAQLTVLQDIPYLPTAESRHRLDLYLPKKAPTSTRGDAARPLIVFLHGGAWRANDRKMFELLAARLAVHADAVVAVPGYRLSVPVKDANRPMHPAFENDVVSALAFLHAVAPAYGNSWSTDRVYVAGHSAGAHLASRVVFFNSGKPVHVRGIVGIDGIYNLRDLIDEYPGYTDFVAGAFGDDQTQWDGALAVPDADRVAEAVKASGLKAVLTLHSADDELLTFRQSRLFDNAVRNAAVGPELTVEWDSESVRGKHDDLLLLEPIVHRIARFVREN
ncbi:Alpha/Beta hydrolase protein [Blastocladiella britannica]|nr:Alpha/Beta hydrolase protein [Blastocladiella britannica]